MYGQFDIWRTTAATEARNQVKTEEFDISSVLDMLNDLPKPALTITPANYMNDISQQQVPKAPPPSYQETISSLPSTYTGSLSISPVTTTEPMPSTSRLPDNIPPPPAYPGLPQEPRVEEEEDEDEEYLSSSPSEEKKPSSSASSGGRSASIHLWQFVKELLLQPESYSGCIHWLDREKGVFKIVDSVRVATLWGQRKNRPAMNYDKLSRSLRQYYKKGIMKKTERTQRLVYQFCHPYHL